MKVVCKGYLVLPKKIFKHIIEFYTISFSCCNCNKQCITSTLLLALDCDLNVPLSAEVLIGLVRCRVDSIILLEKVIRGNHFEHELAERIGGTW